MKSTTLTIRLSAAQRDALQQVDKRLGRTESQYISELLDQNLASVPFGERLQDLAGVLDSSAENTASQDSFRDAVGEHNRRPA